MHVRIKAWASDPGPCAVPTTALQNPLLLYCWNTLLAAKTASVYPSLFLVSSLFESYVVIHSYLRLERHFCSIKSCEEANKNRCVLHFQKKFIRLTQASLYKITSQH